MPPKKNTTATPKRGAGKGTKTKCDLCLTVIVEDKEDVLQCEGSCQLWFHCYCAGVSQNHFKSLASDDNPFVCLQCSQQCHHATVSELQSEVVTLRSEVAELRAALEALQAIDNNGAIASLKEEVEQLKLRAQPLCDKEPAQLWSQVVRKGKGRGKEKGKKEKGMNEEPGSSFSSGSGPVVQLHDGSKPPRVRVDGARKIWGTLRSTTTVAVTNSLKALTNIAPTSLSIKRKFKTSPTNPKKAVRWWFVIRGEECTLQQLQDSWKPVHLQTSWKLEPLYEFAKVTTESPAPTHPAPVAPNPQQDPSRVTSTESSQTIPSTGSSTLSHDLPTQPQGSDPNTTENTPLASQPPQ